MSTFINESAVFPSKKGLYFWLFITVSLLLLTALPTLAQDQTVDLTDAAPAVLTDEMLTEIDAYTADAMSRFTIPGVTIAIVQNGEIVHMNAFGVRELGSDSPVTPDTTFMIGSVPKAMTAMMIGTLVDEGVLEWDTPVANIFPTFTMADPESSRTVTFRNLLSMGSGLPNFDISLFIQPYTPEQVIDTLVTLPLVGTPGENYAYSNQGYTAAAYIAAIATGAKYGDNLYETYDNLMQTRVFDPIGMAHTRLDFDAGLADANVASPHSFDLTTGGFSTFPVELERGGFSIIPAGGTTWSTAEDLARYLITQMNHGVTPDGERIVSEGSLLETWKPEMPTPNNTYYALGWVVKPAFHGLQQIEYGGGNLGYTSFVAFLPEANLGVVVLTNRVAGDAFTHAITQYVYETAFGLEHEAETGYFAEEQGFQGFITEMSSSVETHVDPETVATYVGKYEDHASVGFNENGDFVLSAAFGDFPLYGIPDQPNVFVMGLTFGLTVQFAEDGSSVTISAGDSQPSVTLTKIG